MKKVGQLFLVACIASSINIADATELDSPERTAALMVSRNTDGDIRGVSAEALRRLIRIANQQEQVRVWVTLNVPFDPYLPEYSADAAAQEDRLNRVFDSVLDPLLNSGQAWYPEGERSFRGPSLVLHVTASGVRRLANDRRVGQIVGVRQD